MADQDNNITKPQSPELVLLLIRPFLEKIFETPSDKSFLGAKGIITSYGLYDAQRLNNHALERIPIFFASESGHVGYTIPMRFDLLLCFSQISSGLTPPLDYPIPMFNDHDVMIVTQGVYIPQLIYNSEQDALTNASKQTIASKIIYASITSDDGMRKNLRALEATTKSLLKPGITTIPSLPSDIIDDWINGFLNRIFNRAKENIK